MNSNTILYLGDNKAIRSNPLIRKPRSQEVKTVLNSGPLTVVQVRTVKGKIAYMFKARPTKYAYDDDLRKITFALLRRVYPQNSDKAKTRQYRYRKKHPERELARKRAYYWAHREEMVQKQRQRRALQRTW